MSDNNQVALIIEDDPMRATSSRRLFATKDSNLFNVRLAKMVFRQHEKSTP